MNALTISTSKDFDCFHRFIVMVSRLRLVADIFQMGEIGLLAKVSETEKVKSPLTMVYNTS